VRVPLCPGYLVARRSTGLQWAASWPDRCASGAPPQSHVKQRAVRLPLHPSTMYHGRMQRSASELAGLGRFEEPAVLILTSLVDGPLHGYGVVKDVEDVAPGPLGPRTLYATPPRPESRRLIAGRAPHDPRPPSRISP